MAKKRTKQGVRLTLERLVALRLPWTVSQYGVISNAVGERLGNFHSAAIAEVVCEVVNRHLPRRRKIRCGHCDRVVVVPAYSGGSPRKYCSDRCRAYASVQRRQTAIDLASEGFSIDMIARTVDSSRATVRGWLRASKEAGGGR